jgi:ribosomal protein S21
LSCVPSENILREMSKRKRYHEICEKRKRRMAAGVHAVAVSE